MQLKHNYYFFKSALTDQQCNAIIEAGLTDMAITEKNRGEQATDATTFDFRQKGGEKSNAGNIAANHLTVQGRIKKGLSNEDVYVRDTKVGWLGDRWIYDLVHPFIHEANKRAGWNFQWDFSETCQFTVYKPGQFYSWHTDSNANPYIPFDPTDERQRRKNKDGTYVVLKDDTGKELEFDENYREGQFKGVKRFVPNPGFVDNHGQMGKIRKLSVTINLTNPKHYKGGNLKFDLGPHTDKRFHTCTEIRPRGSIIVFPSHLFHQVTPVTEGTRYSLVIWSLGRPFV
jgi:PKHD-type hydroxylase